MDDESGESMELMEEMPLKGMGEAELERLVRGWRRGAGSWFQRRGEAYWKERSVIRKEDVVGGWARVTKDEERVLRGGWTVTRLYRQRHLNTIYMQQYETKTKWSLQHKILLHSNIQKSVTNTTTKQTEFESQPISHKCSMFRPAQPQIQWATHQEHSPWWQHRQTWTLLHILLQSKVTRLLL